MNKNAKISIRTITVTFLVALAVLFSNAAGSFSLAALNTDMSRFVLSPVAQVHSSWFTSRVDGERLHLEVSFNGLDGRSSVLKPVGAIKNLELVADEANGYGPYAYSDEFDEYRYFAYQINYVFTYNCTRSNPLDAYVRFVLSNHLMQKSDIDLQILAHQNTSCGSLTALTLIEFTGENPAFYFPYPLSSGETVELAFIFTSRTDLGSSLDLDSLFSFDLVQIHNNASVIHWNVIIENGTVSVFCDRDLRTFQNLGLLDLSLFLMPVVQNSGIGEILGGEYDEDEIYSEDEDESEDEYESEEDESEEDEYEPEEDESEEDEYESEEDEYESDEEYESENEPASRNEPESRNKHASREEPESEDESESEEECESEEESESEEEYESEQESEAEDAECELPDCEDGINDPQPDDEIDLNDDNDDSV